MSVNIDNLLLFSFHPIFVTDSTFSLLYLKATPIGRIVNRFSTDIFTLDEKLVATMRSYLATLSNVIGTIIVVS